MMEGFAKTVNSFQPLTTFPISFIIDVSQGLIYSDIATARSLSKF